MTATLLPIPDDPRWEQLRLVHTELRDFHAGRLGYRWQTVERDLAKQRRILIRELNARGATFGQIGRFLGISRARIGQLYWGEQS